MKKSLILLEKYRKKMAWIVAIIITLLMVSGMSAITFFIAESSHIAPKNLLFSDGSQWALIYIFCAIICIFCFTLFLSFHLVNIFFRPMRLMVENLEDFTGNINHEFKTSLAEVISSLELAEITKDYKKGTHQAIESSRRMNMILDSLGHTIHLVNSDYRKETVNLVIIFEEALKEFYQEIQSKNLTILKKYSQNQKIQKFIDHEPLILVFRNILKNAIRYSKNNGKIEISITKHFFQITDYGVGISTENLDKVFGRYFREDYSQEGSGIGLALAKKIVDRYGWELKIQSKKTKFTTVTVYFSRDKE